MDLTRLVRTVWSYRRFVLLSTALACVLYAGFLLVSYLTSPLTQEASVVFELPFLEADANTSLRDMANRQEKYPNGADFAPDDIVALPVLEEVYRSNQLARYDEFRTFRAGFTLTKSSAQLEMLRSEYRSRLAEGRLTAQERAGVEQDFAARMAALLAEPSYQLSYKRRSYTTEMPAVLLGKIVGDVLDVWARQAEERKGVLRSGIVAFTAASIRQDYAAAAEPIVAVDLLRTRARRLVESVNSLGRIEGASATRLGDTALSLADTRASLEDTVALRLEPGLGTLLDLGVMVSPPRVKSYLESRVVEASSRREELAVRVETLRRSLVSYGNEGRVATSPPLGTARDDAPIASVPQAEPGSGDRRGGNFLDSLLQLSTRRQDQQFRQTIVKQLLEEQLNLVRAMAEQEYYEQLLSRFRGRSTGATAMPEAVQRRVNHALDQLEASVRALWAIHQQLVDRNSTPATQLYRVAEPSVVASGTPLGARIGFTFALLILGCLTLLPVVCLVHAAVSAGTKELA